MTNINSLTNANTVNANRLDSTSAKAKADNTNSTQLFTADTSSETGDNVQISSNKKIPSYFPKELIKYANDFLKKDLINKTATTKFKFSQDMQKLGVETVGENPKPSDAEDKALKHNTTLEYLKQISAGDPANIKIKVKNNDNGTTSVAVKGELFELIEGCNGYSNRKCNATYTFDKNGNKTKLTVRNDDGTTTTTKYNSDGSIKSTTVNDKKGKKISKEYTNDNGLFTKVTYKNGYPKILSVYDNGGNPVKVKTYDDTTAKMMGVEGTLPKTLYTLQESSDGNVYMNEYGYGGTVIAD